MRNDRNTEGLWKREREKERDREGSEEAKVEVKTSSRKNLILTH